MKTNLQDLTFIIPVRLDSITRVENLVAVIRHICRYFDTNICVVESGPFNNGIINSLLGGDVNYTFMEDKDPIFHRTKYSNLISKRINTPFLALWDADVVINHEQIEESINALRSQKYDISYPYDGRFLDTSNIIRSLYLNKSYDFEVLNRNQKRMNLLYGSNHRGGAFLANTLKYIEAGAENESFYGWGPEDFERYDRWLNLKYSIHLAKGVLFHLSHTRDVNGKFNSLLQMEQANNELRKTRKSTLMELRDRHKVSK